MTPDRVTLLDRITNFDIDGGESALPFAARLAREHGWSRPFADRVVREYRRYVFLAVTGDSPVCPSEEVDAAWHLHLTYTRSYWKRFCGEVLGRPLHHEPTKGGPAEARKHRAMYAATLARYRDTFGEEPPADVWPSVEVRFGDAMTHRVVNTARNWVIPKTPVKRVGQLAAAFVLFAAFVPGCAGGGLNPFALKGAQFLGFLIPALIGAVCVGRVIRSAMRGPNPYPGDEELDLTWEQAAYLAGGYPRLTTAAIARLVETGAAAVSDDISPHVRKPGRRRREDRRRSLSDAQILVRGPNIPEAGIDSVEMAVYHSLPVNNTRADLKPVQEAVEARFAGEAARLEAEGFTIGKTRQAGIVFAAILPVLLVLLCFAVPRLLMGWWNDKPVGYLVFTLAFGAIFGLFGAAVGSLHLSRRGKNVIERLQARNPASRTGNGSDAALAVALFGTAALAGTSIAYLQPWYPHQTTGSGCGSGCGTGCGGGDGGGCGGGGCGGCGGD